jgi:hypothetical protein
MYVNDFKYEDDDFVSWVRRHLCVQKVLHVAFVLPILKVPKCDILISRILMVFTS